ALWPAGAAPHVFRLAFRAGQLVADLLSDRGILQPLHELVFTALVEARRNGRTERSRSGDIGILVGGDVEPGGARLLDLRDDGAHLAPVLPAGNLEMPDLDRDVGLAADAEGFVECLRFLIAFV